MRETLKSLNIFSDFCEKNVSVRGRKKIRILVLINLSKPEIVLYYTQCLYLFLMLFIVSGECKITHLPKAVRIVLNFFLSV